MESILRQLDSIARRGRQRLLLQQALVVAAAFLSMALVLVLADVLLRLPGAIRLLLLLALLGGTGALAWRRLVPAWRFRPSSTSLALRAERADPRLAGRLASAVEFRRSGLDRTNPLAAAAVAATDRTLGGAAVPLAWRREPLRAAGLAMLGAVAVAGVFAALFPQQARLGAERLLLPLGSAAWPARTEVASSMGDRRIHPQGRPLVLAAELVKGDPQRDRVVARVRTIRDGRAGPWDELVLTRQSGRRFERRVAADGDAVEFAFASSDFELPLERVELVPPPAVRNAVVEIEPPAYAAAERPRQRFELGPGTDRRGSVPAPQLAGSVATLALTLNKPLAPPPDPSDPSEHSRWIGRTLAGLPADASVAADPIEPMRWVARWTLDAPVRVEPRLRDEHGLESDLDAVFRIDVVDDLPPSVAILDPASDEAVLPSAVVPLVAEARDDLAVSQVAFEATLAGEESTRLGARSTGAARVRFEETLSLESLGVGPGRSVQVVALAEDRFESDGQRRPASRSQPRTLRVVDRAEFERQVRDDLSALRQGAIRADGEQARLQSADDRSPAAQGTVTGRVASMAASVEAVRDRIERNRLDDRDLGDLLREAQTRLRTAADASMRAESALRGDSEGADDSTGADRPADAERRDRSDRAGTPGDRAAGADRAAATGAAGDSGPEGDAGETSVDGAAGDMGAEQADAARAEVRRELEALVSLLDSDEDAWTAMRRLDRLAEALRALREETLEVGQRTLGQRPDQLSEEDLAALASIAQRQREIGAEAAEAIQQAAEQSERLQASDRARSEVMRQAAEIGRQAQVEEALRDGAQQAEQNRMQQSAENQQQAQRGLERMRQALDETRKVRTETLRRLMTDLEELIEALLRTSESEAAALRDLLPAGPPWAAGTAAPRATAAIRLERNTQSVVETAASGGADAEEVVRILQRAAVRQADAIRSLRRPEPVLPEASAAMERSSALLRDALDLVRRIRAEAEAEQARERREALAAAYRGIAATQGTIRGEALAAADAVERGELAARRLLLETRRLAGDQESLRDGVVALRAETAELDEAVVFLRSHEWLESWSGEAAAGLRGGDLGEGVRRRQALVVETALALAESLDDEGDDEDEFAGQEQASSGGGGGGGGAEDGAVPPIAELRMLRRLQEQVYRRTRSIDEAPPADPIETRRELADLAEMQESIRALGEALLERLEAQQGGGAVPDLTGPDAAPQQVPVGVAWRASSRSSAAVVAQAQSAPGAPEPSPPPPSPLPPPSLDELLGIEEESPAPADAEADRRRLGERLEERAAADDFREAIAAMAGSATRLARELDPGLATQRLQEEAIRRLDTLIRGAERQRRQRSSQQSQGEPDAASQPSPPSGSAASQRQPSAGSDSGLGDGDMEGDPPPFAEAELGRLLEEGRVEWGQLPQRLRDLVRQGRRDRISSPYRLWTEQYYRRLAEELRP
jgi:hypothetical protein